MNELIEIDGHKTVVAFDREIRMLRGEFVDLNGHADFVAEDMAELVRQGRISLRVFLDICNEKGVNPFVNNLTSG